MGQKEFSIKLELHELQAIRDHFQSVVNLNRQIAEMSNQLVREKRSLELAWRAGFFRSKQHDELPDTCPPFIKNNTAVVTIEADGIARWTEKTDGE